MNDCGYSQPLFPVLPPLPPGPHPDSHGKPPLPLLPLEEETRFRKLKVLQQSSFLDPCSLSVELKRPSDLHVANWEHQSLVSRQSRPPHQLLPLPHIPYVLPRFGAQHPSRFPRPFSTPYPSHFSPTCRRPAPQEFNGTSQFYIYPSYNKDGSSYYESHEETNTREPFPPPWKPNSAPPTFGPRPDSVIPKFHGEPPPQPNYSRGWGRGYHPSPADIGWVASPPPLPNAPHENQLVSFDAAPRPSTPECPKSAISSRKRSGQVSRNTNSRVSTDTLFNVPTKPSSESGVTSDLLEGVEPFSRFNDINGVDSSSPVGVQKIQHSSVSPSQAQQVLDNIGAAESISSNWEQTGSHKHGSFHSLPTLAAEPPGDSLQALKQETRSLPFVVERSFSSQNPSLTRKRSESVAIGEQPPIPEAPNSQKSPVMEKPKDIQPVSISANAKRFTKAELKAGGSSIKPAMLATLATPSANGQNLASNNLVLLHSPRTRPYPGVLTPSDLAIKAPIGRKSFSSKNLKRFTQTYPTCSVSDFTSENKNPRPSKAIPVAEARFTQMRREKAEETRFVNANSITGTLDEKVKRKGKKDSHDKLHQSKRKASVQSKVMEGKRNRNYKRVKIERHSPYINQKINCLSKADGTSNAVHKIDQDPGSISGTDSSKDRHRSCVIEEKTSDATKRCDESTPKALTDPIGTILNLVLPAERLDRVPPIGKKHAKSGKSITLGKSKEIQNPETNIMQITVQEPGKYSCEGAEAVDTSFDCDQAFEAAASLFSQELVEEINGILSSEEQEENEDMEEEEASLARTTRFKNSFSISRVLVIQEPDFDYLYETIGALVEGTQSEMDYLESVPAVEKSSASLRGYHSRPSSSLKKVFSVSKDKATLWESIDVELRSDALVTAVINSVVANVSPEPFPTLVASTPPVLVKSNPELSSIAVEREPHKKDSGIVPIRESQMGNRPSNIGSKKTTKRRNFIPSVGVPLKVLPTRGNIGKTKTQRTRLARSKQRSNSSSKTVVKAVEGLPSLKLSSSHKTRSENATEEALTFADRAIVLYRPPVGLDEVGRLNDVPLDTEMSQTSPGHEVSRVKPRAKPKKTIIPTTCQFDGYDENEIPTNTADIMAIKWNFLANNNNNDEKQSVLEVLGDLQASVSTSISDSDSLENGTDQQCSPDLLAIKKQEKAVIESSVEDSASNRITACPKRGNGKEASKFIASAELVMELTSTEMETTSTPGAAYCQEERVDLEVLASDVNEPKVTEPCISPLASTNPEGQDLVNGTQSEIDIPTQVLKLDLGTAPLPDTLQTCENVDCDELVAASIDSMMEKAYCNANAEITSIKGKGEHDSTFDSGKVDNHKEATFSSSITKNTEEWSSNGEESLHIEPQLLDHSYVKKKLGRESHTEDTVSELEPDDTFRRWCGQTQRHLLPNSVTGFDLTGHKSCPVLNECIKESEQVVVPDLNTVDHVIQVDGEHTHTEFISNENESNEEEIRIFEEISRNEKCSTKDFADGEVNPKQEDEKSNDEEQIENPVVASLIDRELKEIDDFIMPLEEEKPCNEQVCSSMKPLVAICMEALREQRNQDQEISTFLAEEGNPDLLSFASNLLESQPFTEANNDSPSMEIDLSARNLSEEPSPSEQQRNASTVPEFDREEEITDLENPITCAINEQESHIMSTTNERESPHEKKEISTTRLDVVKALGAVSQEQSLLDTADIPRNGANSGDRDSKLELRAQLARFKGQTSDMCSPGSSRSFDLAISTSTPKVPGVRTTKTYFQGDLHKLKCVNTHVETKRNKHLLWTASALNFRSESPVIESSPSPCSQEMCSPRTKKPNRSSSPQKPLLRMEKPVIPPTFVEPKPSCPDLSSHSCTSVSSCTATNMAAIVGEEPVVSSPRSSFRWTDNGGFNHSDDDCDEEILIAVSAEFPPSPRPLLPLFGSNVHGVRRKVLGPPVASSILSEKPARILIASSAISANGLGLGGTKHPPIVLRSADGNWFQVTGLDPCLPVPGHKTQKSPVVTSPAPERKCTSEYSCSELDECGKITVSVKELLDWPGRLKRDKNVVVIMRGLPGSGKSYAAKLIRAKELSMGGCAPRILSINDYFYFDTVANAPVIKMRTMYPKTWEYRHDPARETEYRMSLAERFKKLVENRFQRQLELIDDGASLTILDDVNAKSEHYEELVRFAWYRGFYVLVAECTASLPTCQTRSRAHQRSLEDIRALAQEWGETPVNWPRLDLCWLFTTPIPFRQRRISDQVEMVDDSLLLDLHLSVKNDYREVEGIPTVEKHYVETPYDYLEKKVRWADLEIV